MVIIEQSVTIPAPVQEVWDFLMDVPSVSRCVPGVEAVRRLDQDTYLGVLKVKVGPISVRLEGSIKIAERDLDTWQARIDVNAVDHKLNGALNARMTMVLRQMTEGDTSVVIHTAADVMGKLGEFGQGLIRKKADQILSEFAARLSRELLLVGGEVG